MKLLRFTLRDLFWLVLVAGLAAGWWADRARLRAEMKAVRLQLILAEDKNWHLIKLAEQPRP